MYKFILAIVTTVLFVISGCIINNPVVHMGGKSEMSDENKYPSTDVRLPNDVLPSINSENILDDDTFILPFKASETVPEMTVVFTKTSGPIFDEFNPIYTFKCVLKQANVELQSFEIESTEVLRPEHIAFLDMDFDEHLDMSVVWFTGNANRTYYYFRYDIENNVFEEIPFFSTVSIGINLFTDTKQIIVTVHDWAAGYGREMYQYDDGEYTLLRIEYADVIEYSPLTYRLHIIQYKDDGITEVYTAILTRDEYYEDFTVRDSILRFGYSEF